MNVYVTSKPTNQQTKQTKQTNKQQAHKTNTPNEPHKPNNPPSEAKQQTTQKHSNKPSKQRKHTKPNQPNKQQTANTTNKQTNQQTNQTSKQDQHGFAENSKGWRLCLKLLSPLPQHPSPWLSHERRLCGRREATVAHKSRGSCRDRQGVLPTPDLLMLSLFVSDIHLGLRRG